jgi:hypothetical protein
VASIVMDVLTNIDERSAALGARKQHTRSGVLWRRVFRPSRPIPVHEGPGNRAELRASVVGCLRALVQTLSVFSVADRLPHGRFGDI